MKRTVLFGGLLAAALAANAQQRLVLYEEFSGENCGPCAAANPGLWTLLTTGTNPNKVMLIKYQSPIPSGGPIYNQNTTDVQNRMTYYTVPFAPYGRLDGAVTPGPNQGHVGDLNQASIDAETAMASPFNITVTNTVTGTNINATINVTAVAAYTGTTVKLRAALVEDLSFATPPGSNGETEFHHVVRKMYPSADGQTIPASWTNGQTGTYTFSGAIPSYVDRTHNLFVVVWIQNEGDKKIAQVAKSVNVPVPSVDGAIIAATPANGSLFCVSGAQPHIVTLKNTGSSTLTSAAIYYKVGSGAYQTYNWTGSLAAGASTPVSVGTITLVNGSNSVLDSLGMVNSQADINPANSTYSSTITSQQSPVSMPVATSFEGGMPTGWMVFDSTKAVVSNQSPYSGNWLAYTQNDIKAYDGTYNAIVGNAFSNPGYTSVLSLPLANVSSGPKALDFYYAYAMRGTTGDKLDVVYSTDCGNTWTSVWSKANADLANNPATGEQNLFLPTSTSQFRFVSVNLSSITTNALVGFKTTSNGGNLIFVDKVNFRTGNVTGIEELVTGGNATLYPNPVTDQVTVELNMVKAAKVTFQMVNMLGQQVGQSQVKDLNADQTNTSINTSDLAPGMYFMNVITDKGNLQQKFVKK